jgi:hypothetical protein
MCQNARAPVSVFIYLNVELNRFARCESLLEAVAA